VIAVTGSVAADQPRSTYEALFDDASPEGLLREAWVLLCDLDRDVSLGHSASEGRSIIQLQGKGSLEKTGKPKIQSLMREEMVLG